MTSISAPATTDSAPVPGPAGVCPYLSEDTVEILNGERVQAVLLDRIEDPTACFFTDTDTGGGVAVSVWVYRAEDAAAARMAVDTAAPVDSSAPAAEPAGWNGGRFGGIDGAGYAVSKGTVAVIVTTTQAQSVKAQRLAVAVIDTLSSG